jgi:trk system potassium uptake protein TrkA
MFIIISGGGKVGSFLAEDLAGKGHGVVLIERRPEIVERLVRELPPAVLVISGDGCDAKHLEQAGISRADVFAAVTGDDAENLVACQLARLSYRVRRAVARVNSPRNERIFNALGIEAISSTTVIGRLIEEEINVGEILELISLAQGRLSLVELDLPGAGCPACGRRLEQLRLPPEAVLVTVLRGSHIFVPRGNTRFEAGDRIIALAVTGQREALRKAFLDE